MGYGKIVQVMRPNKSEKKREKEVAEEVDDGKKGPDPEKKAGAEKRLALPRRF
jgi:hypothetical protein